MSTTMTGTLGNTRVKVVFDEFHSENPTGCAACVMKDARGLCSTEFSQRDEREEFGKNCVEGDWHYEAAD